MIFFREAAKENPDNPSHYLAVGRILRILGRDEEALEELRKAVSIFPESAEAHNEIGVVYRNLRQYEEAIRAHQKAIRMSPNDPVPYFSLGHTLSRMGQFDPALRMFDAAIELDPYYAEPYQGYGWVYAKRGQVEEAVRSYYRALQLKPENEYAYGSLGDLYYQGRDSKEAFRLFDLAIKTNPYYRYPYFAKAKNLFDQGLAKQAIRIYEELLRVIGDDSLTCQRLAEYYQGIDKEKSAYFWEKASVSGKGAWKHVFLGNALSCRGKKIEAAEELRKAVRLDPLNFVAHGNLANVYADLKDYRSAVQSYEESIRINSRYVFLYYNLASFYRKDMNDLSRALAVYKEAKEIFPNEALLWIGTGDIYLDQKRFSEAEAEFLQALKIQPDNVNALYEIGYIYFEQRKYEVALQFAEKIRNISASSTHSYWLLKNIAYKQGRWKDVVDSSESYAQLALPVELDNRHFLTLGYAFERLADYKKAIETYRQLLRRSVDLDVQLFVRGYIVAIESCSKLKILWLWHWARGADHWLGKRLGMYSS